MVELVLPKPASVVNGVVSARAGPLSNIEVVLCHTDETWRSATFRTDGAGRFTYKLRPMNAFPSRLPETPLGSLTMSAFVLTPDETREIKIEIDDLKHTEPGSRM